MLSEKLQREHDAQRWNRPAMSARSASYSEGRQSRYPEEHNQR